MYNRALSFITLLSVLLMTSCDSLTPLVQSAKDGQSTVKPSPLQVFGEEVPFNISVAVPEGVLKPKIMYELEVYYATENAEPVYIGKLEYDGDALADNPSPKVEKDFTMAYEDQYERGQLQFKGRAFKKTKPEKIKETEPYTIDDLGKGVITTQELVMAPYTASFVPHGYDNSEEYIPNNVEFFFLQGRSNLRYSERRGEEAEKMEAYIQENAPTRRVNITGMHSPEGPESVNSELANERAAVVEEYYKKMAADYDYESTMDSIEFTLKPVVQDWSAFKDLLMSSSSFTDAQKQEVLDIVNGPGNFVSKELKLQTLSFYRSMFREIYPPLRTAKAEILQIKDKPSDPELAVMVKKYANGEETENLTAKQVAYAATLTPDLAEKEKIYQAAIKSEDSYSAYNNLGAVYMHMALEASENEKMDLIEKAADNFKLSIQKQKSTEAYVNLASAQLIMGDREAAMETMGNISGSASGELGADIAQLKGYAAVVGANYDEAISQNERAGNDPIAIYNKALAMLLKASKEMDDSAYSRVMAAFQDAISADDDNAHAYYGAAITAARMNNADAVTSNLKKAFEYNSSLQERAVTDLEFSNMKDAVTAATR